MKRYCIGKRLRLSSLLIILLLMLPSASASGKDLEFQLSVDRNPVALGQSAQLSMIFNGSSGVPAPAVPEIEGLQVRYVGPSTRMSIVNGRMSSSVTHVFRVVALSTGNITIGPFTAEHDGDTYTSNSLVLEVRDSAQQGRAVPDRTVKQKSINVRDRVFVRMDIPRDRIYVNETVPVTMRLYVGGITVRDIQYPEYDHEGFSAAEFGKPKQYEEFKSGVRYDVVEFRTELFATREGSFTVGPARIRANVLTQRTRRRGSPFNDFFSRDPFDNFFGNYETSPIEVRSDPRTLVVLPLPDKGRPTDFRGAVGEFSFGLNFSPDAVKAGDPVTVTMTISGTGNMNTVSSPVIGDAADFKAYEPLAKDETGKKVFEQVLIPITDSVDRIPRYTFSYFDTKQEQYRTLVQGGKRIRVSKPDKTERLTILDAPGNSAQRISREKIGRDIIFIKEFPGKLQKRGSRLYTSGVYVILHLIPLAVVLSLGIISRRKERLRSDVGYARRLRAPKRAKQGIREAESALRRRDSSQLYDQIFRTLRDYIGDRYHVPSGGITSQSASRILEEKGCPPDKREEIAALFAECDSARYAPAELNEETMKDALQKLKEVIDYLERHKG